MASLSGLLFGFADVGQGQCNTPSFNSPPAFNAGTNPNSVATGDLNGDGFPDLVIPNLTTDTFSILFGDGTGAFLPPVSYPVGLKGVTVGAYPRAAAIGDLNADGKKDLVITGGYNHSWVSVLLGDGTGNFDPALNTNLGNSGELTGVVLGDFNGDGKQDVAASGGSAVSIRFLLGNGTGGFSSTSQVAVSSQPMAIATGDFNLDGLPDVVTINTYPTWGMTIVWGRSDGNFVVNQSITTVSQPKAVAVADINKDGKADIAMAFNWANSGVELRFGDGSGTFGAPGTIFTVYEPVSLVLEDVNNDTNVDLLVDVSGSNSVGVFLGVGNGQFNLASYWGTLPGAALALAVADFNQDGKRDIAAVHPNANVVAILLGEGTGAFAVPKVVVGDNLRGARLVAADFNSDGRPDVAIPQDFANYILIYLTNALGELSAPSFHFIAKPAVSIATGDLNHDGKADLVLGHSFASNPAVVSVLLGTGSGSFTGPTTFTVATGNSPSKVVKLGNFDGDTHLDLAVLQESFSSNTVIAILKGDGAGNFGPATLLTASGTSQWLDVGDVNSDGKLDLVLTGFSPAELSFLLGDGLGGFSSGSYAPAPLFGGSEYLRLADINNDSRPDVITLHRDAGRISVLLNNGAGFNSPTTIDGVQAPLALAVGDYNADGKPDLAVTTSTHKGSIAVLSGDGLGNFAAPVFFTAGTSSADIAVGDFNLDGKPDLVTPNYAAILRNTFTVLPCLSVDDASITEGDLGTLNANFTVTLSAASAQTVRVNYSVSGTTATAGIDFTLVSGRLTFAPGETAKTISVPVIGDALDEVDETFKVQLSNPANANISDGDAVGTILDNDLPPTLSVNDRTVNEGQFGNFWTFTVTLSGVSAKTVTAQYATADGTATSGQQFPFDYLPTSGTLTIPAGQTTIQISMLVWGDFMFEPDENFFLNLSNPTNATITDGQGMGTLLNEDPIPTLTVFSGFGFEGDSGTAPDSFGVSLSNPSYLPVTFSYTTSDDSAIAGSDYVATSGTFTLDPGETAKNLFIPLIGDTVDEISEAFFLNVSNVQNATSSITQVSGLIVDDDGPSISVNNVSINEGNSGITNATFTLTLSAPSVQNIIVRVRTAPGTAASPGDYSAINSNFTILAGATTRTVSVPIIGDINLESDETFFVNLTDPQNGTIADAQGLGTILDDDTLRLVLENPSADPNQLAAVDSLLFTRDPFSVISVAQWFTVGSNQNTRVLIFVKNLQLNQGETASAVEINLSNGSFSTTVFAEDVRSLPNSDVTQVTFRLPDGLPAGICTVSVKAHGQTTSSGIIHIAP